MLWYTISSSHSYSVNCIASNLAGNVTECTSIHVGMWQGVSVHVCVCAPDQNDLQLGTVVVIDNVPQPTDFGFKRSRVRVRLVGWLVFNSTFSTNRLYRATGVQNILCRAEEQDKHTIKQYTKPKVINIFRPGLCGVNPLAMVRLPRRSLSSQSLD